MLTIGILATLGVAYYLSLAAEDYYLRGGEPPGQWFGGMARNLGLIGQIVPDHLRKLWNGFHHETGEKLVQNAGKQDGKGKRRPGWDLTFSAPKDLSCFVATSIWSSVQSIHDEAVRQTLELLEETRAFVRRGSSTLKNVRLEAALLVAAIFNHLISRELDPQLHSHTLLLNAAMTEDGKFGALHSPPFFGKRQRHFLGAYYRALLAYDLRQKLRLEVYRKGTSFAVERMPESLVDARSKRTKQIDAYKAKEGITGGAKAKKATIETRRTKTDVPPRKELYKKWAKENRKHGLTERTIRRMQRAKPRNAEEDLPKLLTTSVENMYRKGVSHFSEIELQIEALQESVNWGVHPKKVLEALAKHLQESEEILAIPLDGQESRYTTKTIREGERRLFENVEHLRNISGLIVDLKIVKQVLANYRLTEEQRKAVEHLVRSPGSIRLLDGRAGTGKTSVVLKACKEIWEKCGYRVIGAAYTGKAAIELEEATGIPTETIHWQLADFKKSFGFQAKHHLKQFIRAAQGKRTFRFKRPQPVKIDGKTVLVADEFSMVNCRHADMLSNLVRLGGGILVATGDSRQIPPIEGQSPFASLCKRVGAAELKDIVRQKDKWARKVAKLMSEGEPDKALAILAERGYARPCQDMDAALERLVRDWSVAGLKRPERAPILASTNREVEALNDACQNVRLKAGEIGGRSTTIADEDDEGKTAYSSRVYRGDRIVFTQNDRRLKVRNGFTGTVIGIERFGRRISVQLDGGDRIIVPVKEYRHIRRGYALTVHKAQGGTYPECWVLAGPHQTLPSAYVELSRAVLATYVYTSHELLDERLQNIEQSPLAEKMSEKPDLRLATDMLEGVQFDVKKEETPEVPTAVTPQARAKGWWEPKESKQKSEQAIPWWKREGKPVPKLVRDAADRRERETTRKEQAAKRSTLAREKLLRAKREQEEQRGIANGQWELEKLRREQAAARTALERLVREHAEQEQEERRRSAMAQAEADERRKALLTQLFLLTSSVEPAVPTETGNRELLNSSLMAMFSHRTNEATVRPPAATPILGHFLGELFAPPKEPEPVTLDVEFVAVEEEVTVEPTTSVPGEITQTEQNEAPSEQLTEQAEQVEAPLSWRFEPESHPTTFASSSSCDSSQSSGSSVDFSSPPLPDHTSSPVPAYQPVSGYTDTQIQSMQMATYQQTGAAQTAASQQANPNVSYYVTNQNQ